MSSIPARMKKIQLKMKALECSQDFSHYKSTGSSDGRCLFRSLVIGMDPTLQSCERDEDGKPTDVLLQIRERSKSDALRAQLIT